MKRFTATIILFSACTLYAASDPSNFSIHKLRAEHNRVRAMEIRDAEGRIVHVIGMRGQARQDSEIRDGTGFARPEFWQLDLAYGHATAGEDLKPWDPIPIPDVPALAVLEHFVGGTAPDSHLLMIRIILYQNGSFHELPPIEGEGEVFLIHDFNENGSRELAITDLLYWHERNEDGLPLSPYVFRFDGKRYVAVTEECTWGGVFERYRKWREERGNPLD